MSLYYCWVTKMANAVVLWVLVYFCVTSVNTKGDGCYGLSGITLCDHIISTI